jgi:periplasmic protein TonB
MVGTIAEAMYAGGAANANARLKEAFGRWSWGGLAAAAALHFAALVLLPSFSVADLRGDRDVLLQVDVPPQVEIPPPPEEITRPQVPVLSTRVDVEMELTIPPTTFDRNPVEALPRPGTGSGVDASDAPVFTPYEVAPRLRNRDEFSRLLERRYPSMLRDAGIGGTVVLWVRIDESGAVQATRVTGSSGHEQLDAVAREVMAQARFTPALNRDRSVPVWIQLPVTFQTR